MYFMKDSSFTIGVNFYDNIDKNASEIIKAQEDKLLKTRNNFKILEKETLNDEGKNIIIHRCSADKYDGGKHYFYIFTITFGKKENHVVCVIGESLKVNKNIKGYVPDLVLPYLEDLHMIDDYFNILKYKIITSKNLEEYQTVDEGFDKLLKKNILEVNNIDELIKKIKSKRYTYNKISRMLIHILCNFTKEHAKSFNKISYIRILGFNNSGREYLSTIKKDTQVPIISKIAKNMDKMLEFEIETTKVYDIINNKNLAKKELQKIIYYGGENNG